MMRRRSYALWPAGPLKAVSKAEFAQWLAEEKAKHAPATPEAAPAAPAAEAEAAPEATAAAPQTAQPAAAQAG